MREHLAYIIYEAFRAYCKKTYHFDDWPIWVLLTPKQKEPYFFIADTVMTDQEQMKVEGNKENVL